MQEKGTLAATNCIRCHRQIQATPFCPFCGAKQERKRGLKTRGNGQGTAYKRGKTWTARVVIGWRTEGDKHLPVWRTKGGFKTKNEALAACPGLLELKEKKVCPTLAHYWEQFSSGEMDKLSYSKRVAYQTAWKKMADIHYYRMDALTVYNLRDIVNKKAKTYYPAKDMKTVLTHLFRLAGADGFVSKDLPSYIILPALNEKERVPFSDIEQASLWKAYESGYKDARIPLIMIYTGMMPGEMLKLTAEMIDWENAEIHGVGMKTNVRKKSVVFLPDAILPLLQDVVQDHPTGLLFPVSQKLFYDQFYKTLELAGCRRLTPYSCRHTTATVLAISEGIAPQTIKKVMRWSSTKMLDRYAHPSSVDAKEAVNKIKK